MNSTALVFDVERRQTVDIATLVGACGVLVLAPHPDDETLGCGGAIAAAVAAGRDVQVAVITDGARSHPGSAAYPPARLAAIRRSEVAEAVRILSDGVMGAPEMLAYPDCGAPGSEATIAEAVDRLAPLAERVKATAAWATWGGDPHIDHYRTAQIASALADRLPLLRYWSFPVWGRFSTTARLPEASDIFAFDATPWRAKKTAALAAHRSQMTRLIFDAPDGFVMNSHQQAHFLGTPEIFIRER